MKDYLYLNHANDYAQSVGAETYHPMVSVVHFDELGAIAHTLNKMGDVYAFFVQYYHYFSYNVNEALHTIEGEKQLLWQLMGMIRRFIQHREPSPQTDRILQDYILLMCDYALLFYQRQFQDVAKGQNNLLSRFQQVLSDYYERDLQRQNGLPGVKYCASELCLSPSYFGDVVRSVSGESPTQVIRRYLIDRAKSLLVSGLTVTQVADELGFEYPQHFTRFFKKTQVCNHRNTLPPYINNNASNKLHNEENLLYASKPCWKASCISSLKAMVCSSESLMS